MVERFNRRLGEHLARMPQCLDYQAPAKLLAKLAGHNTSAGKTVNCERMILLLGIGRSACGERPCCDNQKIDEPETTE
jgi:hypothetical protein